MGEVVPALEQAGHRTHALTLPGMESKDADRSGITLRDHVDAVVAEIDSVDPADGKVVLVGHSAGGAIATPRSTHGPTGSPASSTSAAAPSATAALINDELPAANGEVPLPDWSVFEDEDLADLDDEAARRVP